MRRLILPLAMGLVLAVPATAQKVLFDARHGETAGEADWIVDADTSQLAFLTFQCKTNSNRHHSGQRLLTPPQGQVLQSTPELSGRAAFRPGPWLWPRTLSTPRGAATGRSSGRAAFEADWGPLPAGAVYVDSGNEILINGTARPYRLLDAAGAVVDGPTAEVRSGQSRHRTAGCQEGAAAWGQRQDSAGDPGRGAPPSCGAGVILTELGDGKDFHNEFVEIYFDAGSGPEARLPPRLRALSGRAGSLNSRRPS